MVERSNKNKDNTVHIDNFIDADILISTEALELVDFKGTIQPYMKYTQFPLLFLNALFYLKHFNVFLPRLFTGARECSDRR